MGHHYEHFWLNPQFWVAVSFVIFLALMGGKLWRALAGLLDKRAEKVRENLAEATRLREEAEEMLRTAQRRRTEALAEADALVRNAAEEARRLTEAAEAEARAATARRERMAMERIAAAEKTAVDEVRAAAVEVSAAAAREVIAQTVDEAGQAALIDRGIAGIPQALRAA